MKFNAMFQPINIGPMLSLIHIQMCIRDRYRPDGILIAGDMIVRNDSASLKTASSLLRSLAQQYPVYYALGNHEYKPVSYTHLDVYKRQVYDDIDVNVTTEFVGYDHLTVDSKVTVLSLIHISAGDFL